MKIALTGSSGLVGSALSRHLKKLGHTVVLIVRRKASPGQVAWDPDRGELDPKHLSGVDAVVHLAGESIAAKRWTAAQKEKILQSRVRGTKLLAETIVRMEPRPKTLISASAIGFYGSRGEEILTEESKVGTGFLADVCRQWEAAAAPAAKAGVRVANLRLGVVLSAQGGALAKMLPPFKMGAGGIIGNGKQWMSWISIDDLCAIVAYVLEHPELSGPINAVAPDPLTNAAFTAALGNVIHRPVIMPLPGFAARILLGEMADELLLTSNRVVPAKLIGASYAFQQVKIETALQAALSQRE